MEKTKKNLLKHILSLQSSSYEEEQVIAFIQKYLNDKGLVYETDIHNNIYVTKGKASYYPCVVAHMDTVHDIYPNKFIFEQNGYLHAFTVDKDQELHQIGTGGDDLVGVFFALLMLEKFDNIKGAFFIAEEVGCQGSGKADKDFFNDVGYMLQADRRGNNEVITNGYCGDMASDELQKRVKKVVKKNGYKFSDFGSYTDVVELQSKFDISAFNLACGYYDAHMSTEVVCVRDVDKVLKLGEDLIKRAGEKFYPCEYVNYYKRGTKQFSFDKGDDYSTNWWDGDDDAVDSHVYKIIEEEFEAPWWDAYEWEEDENGKAYVKVAESIFYIEVLENQRKELMEDRYWELRYGSYPVGLPSKNDPKLCKDCNAEISLSLGGEYCTSCREYYEVFNVKFD